MPKRVKGISIVSCSPNSKYVAFGSLRGKFDRELVIISTVFHSLVRFLFISPNEIICCQQLNQSDRYNCIEWCKQLIKCCFRWCHDLRHGLRPLATYQGHGQWEQWRWPHSTPVMDHGLSEGDHHHSLCM